MRASTAATLQPAGSCCVAMPKSIRTIPCAKGDTKQRGSGGSLRNSILRCVASPGPCRRRVAASKAPGTVHALSFQTELRGPSCVQGPHAPPQRRSTLSGFKSLWATPAAA